MSSMSMNTVYAIYTDQFSLSDTVKRQCIVMVQTSLLLMGSLYHFAHLKTTTEIVFTFCYDIKIVLQVIFELIFLWI